MSYADNVIKYKLVAGLVDEEIKEDVLGTTDLDLEATIKMIEGKEGAKKAKQSLSHSFTGKVVIFYVRFQGCGSQMLAPG